MLSRIAVFVLFSTSAFAAIPPCDRVELWRQLAPLKRLNQVALATQASSGDALTQFVLSSLYLDRKPNDNDGFVGVSWLRESALNGFSRAQLILGQLYETGKLLQRDPDEALNLYTTAAEQGDCEAEFFLGLHYLGNHFDVQTNSWNYKGQKDTSAAIFWLRHAGEHGDPDAQAELGRLYESGEGVDQDYVAAVFWYQKAAEHSVDLGGAGQGRNNLGLLYLDGRGLPKDYIEAYKWFVLAGNDGEADEVAARMRRSEVQEAKRRVEDWKHRHDAEIKEANKVFADANIGFK